MKSIKEMIEVMQAYDDNKIIEFTSVVLREPHWSKLEQSKWDWIGFDYRIKDQPKKRILTTMELFESGATHIKDSMETIITIITFSKEYISLDTSNYTIDDFIKYKYTWTADRKTWNSFEIEE